MIDLLYGDCVEVLRRFSDDAFDAIVTDPPYGLRFMNCRWDYDIPSVDVFTELLRVARPGAHMLCFGGTRTFHRIMCRIEDAGWITKDLVIWVYGSGMPQSQNIAKALEKAGMSTELSQEWAGWGTRLKPALEPIALVMKPFDGRIIDNVLQYGTGALNIDGCRVPTEGVDAEKHRAEWDRTQSPCARDNPVGGMGFGKIDLSQYVPTGGRWPANLIHDGSDEVLEVFDRFGDRKGAPLSAYGRGQKGASKHINMGGGQINCVYGDDGSAARFFYCAKASRSERTIGGRVKNEHPTVKPIRLMRYLCRLITRRGGTVLDPYVGSGTTALACLFEGFSCVGVDKSKRYLAIAGRRIGAYQEV